MQHGQPFTRDTGVVPVETVAAGTLSMPDGRSVFAVTDYGIAVPADGRRVWPATLTNPNNGTPMVAVSIYSAGTLMTPDGRPVQAITGTA